MKNVIVELNCTVNAKMQIRFPFYFVVFNKSSYLFGLPLHVKLINLNDACINIRNYVLYQSIFMNIMKQLKHKFFFKTRITPFVSIFLNEYLCTKYLILENTGNFSAFFRLKF